MMRGATVPALKLKFALKHARTGINRHKQRDLVPLIATKPKKYILGSIIVSSDKGIYFPMKI
jgi:hypothetical protein